VVRRGLDAEGVELGIMDGLPGLEAAFRAAFSQAAAQRGQVRAKRDALKRVGRR
jgi:putative transposase